MADVKEAENNCVGFGISVAQAPDGLFLTCIAMNGQTLWVHGDI